MIRTDKRLRLCTAMLICNLIFIWGNSLLPGEISGSISDWVRKILAILFSGTGEDIPGGLPIRKLAHFTEFACLGALLSWRFGMLGKPWTLALYPGIAAACVDESIQIFVPDRGPGLRDVAIDCGGVLAGMILLYFGHLYFRRKQRTSLEDSK